MVLTTTNLIEFCYLMHRVRVCLKQPHQMRIVVAYNQVAPLVCPVGLTMASVLRDSLCFGILKLFYHWPVSLVGYSQLVGRVCGCNQVMSIHMYHTYLMGTQN